MNLGKAYKEIKPLFKSGLGSAIGSGKQYMPWIHEEDLVSVFHEALFNINYNGVYNAVSSESVTNYSFSKQLAKSLHKPFFAPDVPGFMLKLMLGDRANVLLEGSRVNNKKLIHENFEFKFPTLSSALNNLLFKN